MSEVDPAKGGAPEPQFEWDGTQYLPARPVEKTSVRVAPISTRIGSALLGLLVYYGLWLVVSAIFARFGLGPPRLLEFAASYLVLISLPLTVRFGQSPTQFAVGLAVARSGVPTSSTGPPGPMRAIIHITAFALLLPIVWIPLAFHSRALHELIAGTVVLDVTGSYSERKARWARWALAAGWIAPLLGLIVSLIVAGEFLGVAIVLMALALIFAVPVLAALLAESLRMLGTGGDEPNSADVFQPIPADLGRHPTQDQLGHLLHFTARDLELNREGRLSIGQRLHLLGGDIAWWSMAFLCIAGPVILFFAHGSGLVPLSVLKLGNVDLIGLFVAGAGVWALHRAIDGAVDALRGRVLNEETHLRQHGKGGEILRFMTFHRLLTDAGQDLKVRRAPFDAVNPTRVYRAYFAPLSKVLLSLDDILAAMEESTAVTSTID